MVFVLAVHLTGKTALPSILGFSARNANIPPQYNKWMFDKDKLNFPFPLFTTAVHMLVQFSLASLTLYFIPSLRPQNGLRSDPSRSRHETEPDRPIMTKMFYLTRIAPCGAATGLDIGLGNTSLKFITLTFYSKSPFASSVVGNLGTSLTLPRSHV